MLVVNGGAGRRDLRALLDVGHLPRSAENPVAKRRGFRFTQEQGLDPLFQPAGRFIEILAGGDATAADRGECRRELRDASVRGGLSGDGETGGEIPIRAAAKGQPLQFALHQQADGDRLHAAGGESLGDFLPQSGLSV